MKALTKAMLEKLIDCHERELQSREPCWGVQKSLSLKGLIIRGLMEAKPYTSKSTGKLHLAFFVTEHGKQYLEHYTSLDTKKLL
jgi:hypothetical protein